MTRIVQIGMYEEYEVNKHGEAVNVSEDYDIHKQGVLYIDKETKKICFDTEQDEYYNNSVTFVLHSCPEQFLGKEVWIALKPMKYHRPRFGTFYQPIQYFDPILIECMGNEKIKILDWHSSTLQLQ